MFLTPTSTYALHTNVRNKCSAWHRVYDLAPNSCSSLFSSQFPIIIFSSKATETAGSSQNMLFTYLWDGTYCPVVDFLDRICLGLTPLAFYVPVYLSPSPGCFLWSQHTKAGLVPHTLPSLLLLTLMTTFITLNCLLTCLYSPPS